MERREAARSAVSGKSLARVLRGCQLQNADAIVSAAVDYKRLAPPVQCREGRSMDGHAASCGVTTSSAGFTPTFLLAMIAPLPAAHARADGQRGGP